jgi:ethanolamine ammonia-lyase small subunit
MSDWDLLRKFTQARIGIGRAGHAMPTSEHLKFQMDHARARDAVHWSWDVEDFSKRLKKLKIPTVTVKTSVQNRREYLTRPDLGRSLDPSEQKRLKSAVLKSKNKFDIAIIVTNGLSSAAIENHGLPYVKRLWKELKDAGFKVSPIFLVENGRVALSDSIGASVRADMTLMVLGERPGLSSFDSLAMYLTYNPRIGNTDAQRNCISNIRPPDGLNYEAAVKKTLFLVTESLRRKLSGVGLKEESGLITE